MAILVKAVQAFFFDEGLQCGGLWRKYVDADAVVLAYLIDKPVGFRVQAAGVEAEDLDVFVEFPGHVYQHHIFRAAKGQPQFIAKVFEGEFENVLGRLVGVACRQLGCIEGVAHRLEFLVMVTSRVLCGDGSKSQLCD